MRSASSDRTTPLSGSRVAAGLAAAAARCRGVRPRTGAVRTVPSGPFVSGTDRGAKFVMDGSSGASRSTAGDCGETATFRAGCAAALRRGHGPVLFCSPGVADAGEPSDRPRKLPPGAV